MKNIECSSFIEIEQNSITSERWADTDNLFPFFFVLLESSGVPYGLSSASDIKIDDFSD